MRVAVYEALDRRAKFIDTSGRKYAADRADASPSGLPVRYFFD